MPGASQSRKVAVFDLDRTITEQPTYMLFPLLVARRKPLKFLNLPVVIGAMGLYKLGVLSRKRLKEITLRAVLKSAARNEVNQLARTFVDKQLKGGLRSGAREAIADHRKAGDYLVLATASLDFYASRFAEALGFDQVVCTRISWDGSGHLTGRIEGENCYGQEKLAAVQRSFPCARDQCRVTVYTDDHADMPLLQWADKGVAVNPTRALKLAARQLGFQVVDWGRAVRLSGGE